MSLLQQSHRNSQDLTKGTDQPVSLDFDDIQHFLMSRPPARAARYEFLAFKSGLDGRRWLTGLIDKVGTASAVGSSLLDARWVTVGFTWNGLQTLGVAEASLATFPEEFRQGMAARAGVLGTTGANHPHHWVGGLASPNLHAIVVLFARDVAERERCRGEHERYIAHAVRSKCRQLWIWKASPHSITLTNASAIGLGSRKPVIAGIRVKSLHPALANRSNRANFFLAILTKKVPLPDCRSRKFFLATAAMLPI